MLQAMQVIIFQILLVQILIAMVILNLRRVLLQQANQFAYSADKMEGNKRNVIWNKVDGSEVVCGTCHGLPPIGHTNFGGLNTCANCHIGVVNAQGQIIDKTKHMNGVKNVFGN